MYTYEGGPKNNEKFFFKNRIFLWRFSKFNHPRNTVLENQYTYLSYCFFHCSKQFWNFWKVIAFIASVIFPLTSSTFWKRFQGPSSFLETGKNRRVPGPGSRGGGGAKSLSSCFSWETAAHSMLCGRDSLILREQARNEFRSNSFHVKFFC
jgi:hypothetical protein